MSRLGFVVLFLMALLSFCECAWEYEAVYHINEHSYEYSINLADFADGSMLICFYETDGASEHGVHEVEDNCNIDDQSPSVINSGSSTTTLVNGVTYKLEMDCNHWLCIFDIKFPANGYYAFFAEHNPSEFYKSGGTELEMLKDSDSHDVSPDFVVGSASSDAGNRWQNTMLGCLAVWAITFIGLLLIINMDVWNFVKPYAFMFASGTLLSVAFSLVLYESTHLITDQSATESLAAGRWSAMILFGFISVPILRTLTQLFFKDAVHVHGENHAENGTEMVSTHDIEEVADTDKKIQSHTDIDVPIDKERASSILWAMILGDFLHNFSDGIFIGAAFLCNSTFAWKMVAITVAHELPQELADFSILVGKLKYTIPMALLYNFLCGISVMLGGIVIIATDVSSKDVGMILAFGAGTYIYVATVHLFEEIKEVKDMAIRILCFCIGCVSIGLILLDHEHCTASSDSGAHAH